MQPLALVSLLALSVVHAWVPPTHCTGGLCRKLPGRLGVEHRKGVKVGVGPSQTTASHIRGVPATEVSQSSLCVGDFLVGGRHFLNDTFMLALTYYLNHQVLTWLANDWSRAVCGRRNAEMPLRAEPEEWGVALRFVACPTDRSVHACARGSRGVGSGRMLVLGVETFLCLDPATLLRQYPLNGI